MKPYIFLLSLEQEIEDVVFSFLLQFVRKDKREQILKQRVKRNADTMLAGELLAMYAISRIYGIPMKEQKICCGEKGKPFLVNDRKIHFNISHSGNQIAVAVCDVEVGIDIQCITPYRFPVVKRVCTQEEQRQIQESARPEGKFTELWTKKEAVIKMKGCGLSGLNQYSAEDYSYAVVRLEQYYLCVVWEE